MACHPLSLVFALSRGARKKGREIGGDAVEIHQPLDILYPDFTLMVARLKRFVLAERAGGCGVDGG